MDALSHKYPTRDSAHTAAVRLVSAPGEAYRCVEFLPLTVTAIDGGRVFEVVAQPECWRVVELSAREVHLRQQAAMRREVAELYRRADEHDATAASLNPERAAAKHFRRWARDMRDAARAIETQLVVSVRGAA